MKTSSIVFLLAWVAAVGIATADQAPPPVQPTLAELHAACDSDIQKLCSGVQPGGGRILACLKQHKDEVSDTCKQAVAKAIQASTPATT